MAAAGNTARETAAARFWVKSCHASRQVAPTKQATGQLGCHTAMEGTEDLAAPTVAAYTTEELERLKNDPEEKVYEWQEKPLEDWQRLSAVEAGAMGNRIRTAYLEIRSARPDLTDDEIRAELRSRGKMWESFAESSHATTFGMLTSRDTDEKRIGILSYMLGVRMRDREIDEESAALHIQEYLMEHASRPRDEAPAAAAPAPAPVPAGP